MAFACRAANVRMKNRHNAADISHIGGTGAPVVRAQGPAAPDELRHDLHGKIDHHRRVVQRRVARIIRHMKPRAQCKRSGGKRTVDFTLVCRMELSEPPRTIIASAEEDGMTLTESPPSVMIG